MQPNGKYFYHTDTGSLGLTAPVNGEPATYGNGTTIGFRASSTEQVDAWFKAGLDNGGVECEDPPGLRGSMYLAYLRDPDGNKLCAMYRPA